LCGDQRERAETCLIKDREALLVFYGFPAEHWKHLRATNIIESSFATIATARCAPMDVFQQDRARHGSPFDGIPENEIASFWPVKARKLAISKPG
jgi:hypothetical protein